MSDSDSEGGVPLIEAQFDVDASSKKRKREAEPEASKDSKKAAKKAKRKEKKKQKAKEIDEDDLDQTLGVNHSFERMDGQLLADYVNARTRLYGKELSSVELEDKFISGKPELVLDVLQMLTSNSSDRARWYQLDRATNYGQSICFSQQAVKYIGADTNQATRSSAHARGHRFWDPSRRCVPIPQVWSA
jgi:hypothetical protein